MQNLLDIKIIYETFYSNDASSNYKNRIKMKVIVIKGINNHFFIEIQEDEIISL